MTVKKENNEENKKKRFVKKPLLDKQEKVLEPVENVVKALPDKMVVDSQTENTFTRSKKINPPEADKGIIPRNLLRKLPLVVPHQLATGKFINNVSPQVEEKISKELLEIYENDDGSIPDMKKFQPQKKRGLLTAFFVLLFACLFLGAVAWAGFFFFQPKTAFKETDVVLAITGDEKIVIGQEVNYRVRYRNDQNVPLSKAVLQIRYPDGFVYEKASQEPTKDSHDEWELGTINSADSGYIDITGKMYGDFGSKQSFRVFLNYTPANFSSEFQKVSSQTVELAESPVDLQVQMPPEIFSGEKTALKITLHKKSADVLNNLAVEVDPGKIFSKTSSTPETDKNNLYRWSFANLDNDRVIDLAGIFNADSAFDSSTLSIKLLGWKDEKRDTDGYIFANSLSDVNLVKTDLKSTLAINGMVSDSTIEPGAMMNISLGIKNEGQKAVKNIVLKFNVDAPAYNSKSLLDWQKLDDQNNGDVSGEQQSKDVRRGIIKWDSSKISALKQINPGDEVMVDIHLPLKSADNMDLSQFVNNKISSWVDLKYDQGTEQKTLTGASLNLTVNSDLNFDVKDVISNNAQGLENHKITWLLSNSFHELKNIEVSADIYGDFTWNENDLLVPSGKAVFSSQDKNLVWKIDSMPTNVDVLALQFSVTLNKKNSSQTNLTSKIKIKATDVVTGQDIIKAGEGLTLK